MLERPDEVVRPEMVYLARRRSSYRDVLDALRDAGLPPFRLTEINETALLAWEQQWLPDLGKVEGEWRAWNWREQMRHWRRRHVDRFEVAIWSDEELCGLAVGKPSDRRNNLSIYLLQASPRPDRALKGFVLPIAVETAAAYGTRCRCRELRLVNPLEGVVQRYLDLGFTLEVGTSAAPYCVRPI